MSAAHRRLIGAISAMALLFAVVGVAPASASERVQLDLGVVHGEEGSTIEVARLDVADHHIGRTCTVRLHTENQHSVHPGNDLLITTGDSRAVIADVESEAGGARDLSDDVVLGGSVIVQLRFGPDQTSSMGYDLDVDCGTDETVLAEPTDPGSGTSGGVDGTVAEVDVPPPALPEPCEPAGAQTSGGQTAASGGSSSEGGFTVDENGCPVVDDADQGDLGPVGGDGSGTDSDTSSDSGQGTNTSGTAAPTTTPTTTPTTIPPAASDTGPTGTGSAGGPTATVLGVQQLPDASPAVPVQANPNYAG